MSQKRKSPSRLIFVFLMIATFVCVSSVAQARIWWIPPWEDDGSGDDGTEDGPTGDPTTGSKVAPVFILLGLPNITCLVANVLGDMWDDEAIVVQPAVVTTVSAAPRVSLPPVTFQVRSAAKRELHR